MLWMLGCCLDQEAAGQWTSADYRMQCCQRRTMAAPAYHSVYVGGDSADGVNMDINGDRARMGSAVSRLRIRPFLPVVLDTVFAYHYPEYRQPRQLVNGQVHFGLCIVSRYGCYGDGR